MRVWLHELKIRLSGFLSLVLLTISLYAQEDITALEYFIDIDPGVGNGTSVSITSGQSINESFSVPTGALSPGYHLLGIRTRNAENRWSMYERRLFLIQDPADDLNFPQTTANIQAAEYFIDTDPGVGSGTVISTAGGANILENFSIPSGALGNGYHVLGVRTQNAEGRWSMYERRVFLIQDPADDLNFPQTVSNIQAAEYFIDTDPGVGSGTVIPTAGGSTISENFSIPTGALSSGYHVLCIRTQNTEGRWSMYERRVFLIQDPSDDLNFPQTVSNIQAAEYFIDTDPGVGNGTAITTAGGSAISESVSIATDALSPGYHILGVRTQNEEGRWSMYERRLFLIQDPQNDLDFPKAVSNIQAAEYFIDVDPGVGNGTEITTSGGSTINESISIATDALSPGYHILGIRTQNAEGRWSMYERRLFFIQDPQNDLGFPSTPSQITELEYFIDEDPGVGNGVNVPLGMPMDLVDITDLMVDVDPQLSPGTHVFSIRAKNQDGSWGLVEVATFEFTNARTPTLSTTAVTPTNVAEIPVEISFTQAMTDFVEADIVTLLDGTETTPSLVRGGSLVDNTNGDFSVMVDAVDEGEVSILIPDGAVLAESDGTPTLASDTLRIIYDITAPVVTITALSTTEVRPELSGTIDDQDATLEVEIDGVTYPTTINPDNTWVITPGTIASLAIGTYDAIATATDLAGNTGSDATVDEIEIVATASPTPVLSYSGDIITNQAPWGVSADFGEEVTGFELTDIVTLLNGTTGTSYVNNGSLIDNGTGNFDFMIDPVEGEIGILIPANAASTTSDSSPNQASDTLRITYDITAPTVTINAISTNEASPELSGTIDDLSASLEVEIDGSTYPATINADNTWNIAQGTIASLTIGTYDATATATDLAGNSGSDTTIDEIEIVATANPTPVISYLGDLITNQAPWDVDVDFGEEVTGFEAADIITLLNESGGTSYVSDGSLIDNGNGSFSFVIDPVEGEIGILIPANIATTVSDGGSNQDSDTLRITFDITAPVVTVDVLSTTDTSPELSGTINDLSALLEVEIDGNTYPATINADNTWIINQGTIASLAIGTFDVIATATDLAGNSGNDATVDEIEITGTDDGVSGQDSLALVTFYNATDGANWTDNANWTTGNIVDWLGITLNAENNEVLRIELPSNGLSGTIPSEIDQLNMLEVLNLSDNNIEGLATDFSGLTSATNINLSGNKLDFGDLEPVAGVTALNYSNQQALDQAIDQGDLIIRSGTDQTLTTSVNGTSNLYQWTFNSGDIEGAINASYTIAEMDPEKVGTYGVRVSNSIVTGLSLDAPTIEVLGSAVISINALDEDTNSPIAENVNAYLFPLNENIGDTLAFGDVKGILDVSSTFSFPEVLFGDYLLAVESTIPVSDGNNNQNPNATYVPTFYGDGLAGDADILTLQSDSSILITMVEFPDEEPPGEGSLGGTIEEDFGDEEARVNTRRRAKRRKCGLRRRRTGGRQDDEFELFAYGETNDQGEFEFGFLPQGVYRFFVEYPGIALDPEAEVQFTVGEAGISDDTFVLAVFASPEGIEIEFVLGLTRDYFTDFRIYPNPTADILNIEYSKIKVDQVFMEVISLDGQVLYKKELSKADDNFAYDTALLKPGMYLVQFTGEDRKQPLVYRIIKK